MSSTFMFPNKKSYRTVFVVRSTFIYLRLATNKNKNQSSFTAETTNKKSSQEV